MTIEQLKEIVSSELERVVKSAHPVHSIKDMNTDAVAESIISKVKAFEDKDSRYDFVILGDYESPPLTETAYGDRLEVTEFNYTLYSDDEIVFSIPQENVIYVKRG